MRICLIADATSIHTQRWARYFAQVGDEVHLITYEPPNTNIEGVDLHIIKSFSKSLYVSFIPRHIKIYLLVRKLKPDIVHAHFISKFGFHAAFLGVRPVVMSAWGDDILIIPYWSKFLWYFTDITLGRADKIYSVSKDMADKIIHNFRIPSSKIIVVPFGVDTDIFQYVNRKNTKDVIVLSNRNLFEVYNIETLLIAISEVITKNNNLRFMILGSGPLETKLKQLATEFNINDYVTFVGKVEHENMPEYLHECDIYVSTSTSDGMPTSVLEAMACGKACIVTNVGGVREWIEDGLSGILMPPEQPRILAEKILELSKDASKREKLGMRARKIVAERGSWKKIMDYVRKDYLKLVKSKQ
jgi:glycosyltransferase involved in cell wall biosynthesis